MLDGLKRIARKVGLVLCAMGAVPAAHAVLVADAHYAGRVTGWTTDGTGNFYIPFESYDGPAHAGVQALAGSLEGAPAMRASIFSDTPTRSRTYIVDMTQSLTYEWAITSLVDAAPEYVLVHVRTAGYINAFYRNTSGNQSQTDLRARAAASFYTDTAQGYTQQNYGVATHGYGAGVAAAVSQGNGNGSSQDWSGAFDVSFDLWVKAESINRIVLETYNMMRLDPYASDPYYTWYPDGRQVGWSESFIDPVIVIDPAFADRYQLVQSYIPPMATQEIPEPATSLLFSIAAAMGVAVRRRRF